MRGRFITLEGGEGAGKSTMLQVVRERLESRGIEPLLTREPGGTRLGEALRALVLDPQLTPICPESELLMMFAARAQHVREVIEPALAAGRWVVSDRYTDASHAYQGGGRGQPYARIDALAAWAAPLTPDLTLLLDIAPPEGLARAGARSVADRIEGEALEFFERVREAYRLRAADAPGRFRIIDASRPVAAVRAAVVAVVDEWLRTLEPSR